MSYTAAIGAAPAFDAFALATRLRAGGHATIAWVGNPEPLVAEAIARSAFDAVTLDMQHGLADTASVMRGITAVAGAGKPSIVRVPVGDFAMASRALDFGASGVIAPMINTVADARAFADFMKYPPLGRRSWGPTRAMTLAGVDDAQHYLKSANAGTLALAMIETREALDNLEAILDVEGIDGVFIGPSDLSLTLSSGAFVDQHHPIIDEPVRRVVAAASARGKIAAIFGGAPERARAMRDLGFRLVSLGIDPAYTVLGCDTMLKAMG